MRAHRKGHSRSSVTRPRRWRPTLRPGTISELTAALRERPRRRPPGRLPERAGWLWLGYDPGPRSRWLVRREICLSAVQVRCRLKCLLPQCRRSAVRFGSSVVAVGYGEDNTHHPPPPGGKRHETKRLACVSFCFPVPLLFWGKTRGRRFS